MTLYIYPPLGSISITAAPGTDFATETTLAAIETAVDGLETLVTATNTKLDTLHADIDGVETLIGTTNTNTANTKTAVDAVAVAVAATNTLITDKMAGSLVNVAYNNLSADYTDPTSDVYTYYMGGTVVRTVTITYSGIDKQTITTVAAV